MRPAESFIGQPIRSLQTMLRVIAKTDSNYLSIIPDGIYGPETAKAVSTFQRLQGLPVTAVVDQQTWQAIVSAYEPALVEREPTPSIPVSLNPGQVLGKGERHPTIYLLQGMLQVFSQSYPVIPQPTNSGFLDEETAASLAAFQRLSQLPATGTLDRMTWKHLTRQYPLAAAGACREP